MDRARILAGLVAPIVAFSGIGVAVYINRSWWHLTENAISDLGRVGLPHNYVLNVSFVVASALMIYCFSGWEPKNAVEKVGIITFSVGVAFLALIGMFPEGTTPHYYVSWGFFLISSVGIVVAGVGMGASEERGMAIFSISLFVILWGMAIWAMKSFRGVAPAELIGSVGLMAWYYVAMALKLKAKTRDEGSK